MTQNISRRVWQFLIAAMVGFGALLAFRSLIVAAASPALTGTPTAPTATAGTNTKQIATTEFVQTSVTGVSTTFASSAENAAGTVENKAVDPLGIREAFNASGSAPVYACRAWVNFNGTGTVAIRASGNVSSITDHGTGDYTVNFTTAMPDDKYIFVAPVVGAASNSYNWGVGDNGTNALFAKTATAHRVKVMNSANGGAVDAAYAYLAYFR